MDLNPKDTACTLRGNDTFYDQRKKWLTQNTGERINPDRSSKKCLLDDSDIPPMKREEAKEMQ